jgi:hypothetical protein
MSSIVILAASFITALIGIIRNNRANPGEKSLFGLNLLGAILLGLSITGATAALVQEIRSLRDKDKANRTLQEVYQLLKPLKDKNIDPNVKKAITEARNRIGSMVFIKGENELIPSWVPIYSGAEPENVQERKDQNGRSGSYTMSPLFMAQVVAWYRDKLSENEFTITTYRTKLGVWGRLVAQDMSGHRRITVSQDSKRVDVLWEERDK